MPPPERSPDPYQIELVTLDGERYIAGFHVRQKTRCCSGCSAPLDACTYEFDEEFRLIRDDNGENVRSDLRRALTELAKQQFLAALAPADAPDACPACQGTHGGTD